MKAIWNQSHLEHPPNITWRVEMNKFDIQGFTSVLKCVAEDLGSQNTLHTEAAILSRLIYRMKCKFRHDKGLKNMEKVNRALLSYLNLDLEKEYKNLYSYIEADGKFVVLPSRQMLEYALVRTQGFAKLLARIEETAKSAGIYLKNRMIVGDAWILVIVPYAVVSRIWLLSQHLIKKSCYWYNSLHKYLEKFKIVGVPWMPAKEELPIDLSAWINLPWLSEEISSISTKNSWNSTMFKLLRIQDDELFDNLDFSFIQEPIQLETVNPTFNIPKEQDSKKLLENSLKNEVEPSMFMHDDIGEQISRQNLKEYDQKSIAKSESEIISNKSDEDDLKKSSTIDSHIPEQQKENEDVTTVKNKKRKCITVDSNAKTKIKKSKKVEGTVEKLPNVKSQNNKESQLGRITTKSNLLKLLNKDSFPGVDKLRWNMIKNNSNQFINKLNKCKDKKKQKILVKKAIKCIENWIS